MYPWILMNHHSGANQLAQCPYSRNIIIKTDCVIIILGQSAGAIVVVVSRVKSL